MHFRLLLLITIVAGTVRAQDRAPRPIGGVSAIAERVVYPETARLAGDEGAVEIEVTVDQRGRPTSATVVESPDARLDAAALRAVRQTLFEPAAAPTRVRLAVPVRMMPDGAPRPRPFVDRVGNRSRWVRAVTSPSTPPRYETGVYGATVSFVINAAGAATGIRVSSAQTPEQGRTYAEFIRRMWFDPGEWVGRRIGLTFDLMPPGPVIPPPVIPREAPSAGEWDHPGIVETQPVLVGGLAALQAALIYPPSARADGVQGRVFVQFMVEPDGRVTDPIVIRSPDERLSAAALDAVRDVTFEPGL